MPYGDRIASVKFSLAERLRLAYIWIVYLGSLCEKDGWRNVIHRSDRCDVSLFQLGLRLLEHFRHLSKQGKSS